MLPFIAILRTRLDCGKRRGRTFLLFVSCCKLNDDSTNGNTLCDSFFTIALCFSLLILGGTVAVAVWLSSCRIKKIEPIVALRLGVETHNFKRNHVPLEKTKVPLNLALALKTTFSAVKHNITVCITMLVLSLVVVFSGLMTENVIADMTPFLNLIVGETADSGISINADFEEEFLLNIKTDKRVKKSLLIHDD